MPANNLYDKTIVDRIIDLLKGSELGSYFQKFYYGDPLLIGSSAIPCCVVELQGTKIMVANTAEDQVTQTVAIKLIYNKSDDFDLDDDEEVTGQRPLEEMAEGINAQTATWDPGTVLGLLRKNFTIGDYILDQQIDIRYGIRSRPSSENGEGITAECQLICTFMHHVQVLNRI
jgi:hypothetical protein